MAAENCYKENTNKLEDKMHENETWQCQQLTPWQTEVVRHRITVAPSLTGE